MSYHPNKGVDFGLEVGFPNIVPYRFLGKLIERSL